MIEFMVIALPRSGTTWASVWLTTNDTICLHDPLYQHHYLEMDAIAAAKAPRKVGISCTGIFNFPSWVNSHPARKVILHRPLNEINASMAAIGLPELTVNDECKLNGIKGRHCDWREMFETPKWMYEFLTQTKFDKDRHEELVQIEMQPKFSGLKIGLSVTKRLVDELRKIG